jgi:hypothetical protein
MALTMDNYPGLIHSTAFSYGLINWVTKGVFLGSRRIYLNTQIDDLLLGNRLYAPTLPQCPNDQSCPTLYASGQDLQTLATWQTNLQSDPQFQSFHATFAYNGVGTTWFAPSDPVFAAMSSLNAQFRWLSHTWDHSDLDCFTHDSNGACVPATLAQSLSELNQNINVAPSLGITLDRTSMVTPFDGGLGNPNFVQAAAQVGIQYLVTAVDPPGANLGIVSPFVPSVFEIPRRGNNLFDDVSSPQTGVYGSWPDEYNAMFGPNGTQPLYTQNLTYTQIIDIESQTILLNNMMTYEPYPLGYHIDNSSTYDGTHSMFSDLMDAAIGKYKKMFTLPVVTIDMNEIGPLLKNRASYNASGVTGVYTPGVGVTLTTLQAATIPITGACSSPSCTTYGGQLQDSVAIPANSSISLSLTPGEEATLTSVSVSPITVTGGSSSTGTVTLTGAAPSGGVSVSLTSSNAAVTVPSSVNVAAGSTTAPFSVTTGSVTSTASATITAAYNGTSKTATLTINPAITVALSSVGVNPASVTGGSSSTGTITLSSAAPSGGVSISLTSNNAAVTVPSSVSVAAGSTTAPFSVTTGSVTSTASATITAAYNGTSKTTTLTVNPAITVALSSISVNPASVTGGSSSTGTVSLSNAAPSGGVTVTLTSNNTSAATVPASVTIAAGSSTGSFSVTTASVTATSSAVITAGYNGVSKTATLTVAPPAATLTLSSVSVNPATLTGGSTASGTVTLSSAAPAGGTLVDLWTNGDPAFVPVSVTIAAGATTGSFTVTTETVSSTSQGTITAFYNGAIKTTTITVTPAVTIGLSSVSVNPTTVKGGVSATGTVTLGAPAPTGGFSVALWTNGNPAFVPSSITIAAGATTGTFSVTTLSVSSTLQGTITAFYNGASKTTTISVTP